MIHLLAHSSVPGISGKEVLQQVADQMPNYALKGLHQNRAGDWECVLADVPRGTMSEVPLNPA